MSQHQFSTKSSPGRRVISGVDDVPALLRELNAAGFRGARYDKLVDELWLFGWDVLRGLVRTGAIVRVKTAVPHQALMPQDRQTLHDSTEERDQLVHEALTHAVPAFIRHLKSGRWSPDKGASLSTYFIGACAGGFWKAYGRWQDARARHLRLLAALPTANPEDRPFTQDLDLLHDQRAVLNTILRKATPDQKAICAGLLQDRTQAEIAADIGLTARGVEGRMYQLRRTSWDLVSRGRIDPALVPGSRAAVVASRSAS